MKLIVDSGSTKTDWAFTGSAAQYTVVNTHGINPVVQNEEEIDDILRNELEKAACSHDINTQDVDGIFFYGAGCTPEKVHTVKNVLARHFPNATLIEVESDLLGAARALCGRNEGIAAILGTGANSCLYDGEKIIAHTPALGFILGDEGSGAVLGKKFMNGILKGWLPQQLCDNFLKETGLTMADIIDKVYHDAMPNRFLASTSEFISRNIGSYSALENIVEENFEDFIRINIFPYRCCATNNNANAQRINAVGSIAYYYKPYLVKAAQELGMEIGTITKSPLTGLIRFHFQD